VRSYHKRAALTNLSPLTLFVDSACKVALTASSVIGDRCWLAACAALHSVTGGYSNLLSVGIFPVIFQLVFLCARI